MTDIGFYHLTRSKLQEALPKLLGRVLDAGGRGLILCTDAERARALDAALWLPTDPPWLPHGLAGGEHDAAQPLLIADQDIPPANDARFLVLVDGAASARLAEYDRVLDLFDGGDEAAVAAARARWVTAKEAGHSLTYWQQTARGWEKKASHLSAS
ncbi:MAG: DNA polymerase III subunit chi [Alphaproteobacteria bacterium]|nr:DNA polymerase III subunit chi [Alphaproteobacteria bacterium]